MNNLRNMKKQGGFTLIELMIVIAILAILLAIAIPAYQDYTVRAKMSEALNATAPAKISVSEFIQAEGAFPTPTQAGFSTDFDSEFVKSVSWTTGNTIQVSITGDLGGDTAVDQVIEMSPYTTGPGSVQWTCGTSGTSVLAKYLPSSCRQ